MDRVVLVPVLGYVFQCVGLDEREWVARLRLVIHTCHVETRSVVADRCATRTAK